MKVAGREAGKFCVVIERDKDKEFVGTMEKMIGKEIIPAHDNSNYRLEKEFDPRMDNYSVGFYKEDKQLLSVYHLQYGG